MAPPILTKTLKDLLFGSLFGESFPPKPNPVPLSIDGRTAGLRVLRKYISELVFYRPGAVENGVRQAPISFQIPQKNIHIEWPDNVEDMVFPSIVFLSDGKAEYDAIGLGTYVEEDSRDVYAPGTVVQWLMEYTENLIIEIWTSKKPERRSILAGLETALSPVEQMYGIRFQMPEYFNELACFTLGERELMEEADAARDRRRARLYLEYRFNVVSLVNYVQFTAAPIMKVSVDVDEDTGLEIDLEIEEPSNTRPVTLPRDPCGVYGAFEDD